jgi:DNA-binding MurR/RpiR family transcriptional regulator
MSCDRIVYKGEITIKHYHQNTTELLIHHLQAKAAYQVTVIEEEILEILIEELRYGKITMQNLATKSGSSIATISRLTGKLGFSGYQELCVVARQLDAQMRKSVLYRGVDKSGDLKTELEQATAKAQYSLQNLSQELDVAKLEEFLTLLRQADSLIVLGLGFSRLLGQYLAYHLQQLGKGVFIIDALIPYESFEQLLSLNPLIITISKSAQIEVLEKLLQMVKAQALPHVMLTAQPNGFLTAYASLVITLPDYSEIITPHLNSFFHLKATFLVDFLLSAV